MVYLLRQERDLLRCELDLARREAELRDRARVNREESPVLNKHSNFNIRAIKDLLSEYDGSGSDYCKWEQQVTLLRDAYALEEGAVRLLTSTRLKGKALNWFHSRPEHLALSTTHLLDEMRKMFDHRPSKLMLRKEFERRTWRVGEMFNEYCHEKIILANRIPIDSNEIIDYVIEGVTDPALQDQARLQRFESVSELMRAFERITLRPHPKFERGGIEKESMKPRRDDKAATTGHLEANPTRRGG